METKKVYDDPFQALPFRVPQQEDPPAPNEERARRLEREAFWNSLPHTAGGGPAVPGRDFSELPAHITKKARFLKADLRDSSWPGRNLLRSVWRNVRAEGVNLAGASLREAGLEGVNLAGASLTGADLTQANLKQVNLQGANLTGADLTQAQLEGVDLRGVNLTGARGLETVRDYYYGSGPGVRRNNEPPPFRPWPKATAEVAWERGIFWDETTRWPLDFDPLLGYLEPEPEPEKKAKEPKPHESLGLGRPRG